MRVIFITGVGGFIGFSLAKFLLENKYLVYGIDSLNDYYSKKFKRLRISRLNNFDNFNFYKSKISSQTISQIFKKHDKITDIFHLAAQPGVEFSENNKEYSFINNTVPMLQIFQNVHLLQKLRSIFVASSSSVYGNHLLNKSLSENQIKKPTSLYGFSKSTLEEMIKLEAQNNNKINFFCMRFFTVFGPYGRPDMSIFTFVENILNKKKIKLYNYGKNYRDFTYIDDLIQMVNSIFINQDKFESNFNIINLANGKKLMTTKLVHMIFKILNLQPNILLCPKRKFDVIMTRSSSKKIKKYLPSDYRPTKTNIALKETIEWYIKNRNKI